MKRKIGVGICLFCILLTVAFIFYNSAQPVSKSQKASATVAETIASISPNGGETPDGWRSFADYVRKAAHAVEFFVLGIELSLLFFVLFRKHTVQAIWNVLSLALCTAVIDESIQILSGRGPKVQDVLLDFCGALCAIVTVGILTAVGIAVCKARKQEKSAYAVESRG
ncbi:MAG: VanZ family protein [Candidatus Fimenecus sp.]